MLMAASLVTPVASSLVKGFFGIGVMRSGRGVMGAGREYNNMEHLDKKF